MPAVFLNHDFVQGMARRSDLAAVAVGLLDAHRRLMPEPLRVHPELSMQDTGLGIFVQWASRSRRNPDDDMHILAELLLRLVSGPFVTDLVVDGGTGGIQEEPILPKDPQWRCAAVRHLACHAMTVGGVLPWVLSFDPRSDLRAPRYRLSRAGNVTDVENFRQPAEVARRCDDLTAAGLTGTLAVLDAAGQQPGRLIILDRARDSARRWTLDCSEATLLHALVQLEEYALALDGGLSRELAAAQYYRSSGIEMSRESGEVGRSPTCRRQRQFEVPGHGLQYFDMHAKPGARTRIHIWTAVVAHRHVVYVGHCGEHLLLPGGRR